MIKRKLQVFISSTFTDLIIERQAAVSATLKAGHIPAGMELFTAGDRSQLETIKRWIDESDVYMLILGGRYGSIENKSNISYTEIEYDYAVQQGKPFFAVVITDLALENKIKALGISAIEKENQQALKLFREKVLGNISSFFTDEKDIRLCVHESLADLRENPSVKGWVSLAEVEDTKPLHEEIKKLRAEKEQLEKALAAAPKSTPATKLNKFENLDELTQILANIKINVPSDLAGGKEIVTSLLDIFVKNKDTLINGVTNSNSGSDTEHFYYFNIMPKLIVHGLAENEKISGVRYRRSFVNNKGVSFLAEMKKNLARPNLDKIENPPAIKPEITEKPSPRRSKTADKKPPTRRE